VTNLDFITAALRLLNVIDENESPSAEQGVLGLRTLNQMLSQWARDGVRLGWYTQTDLQATAPIEAADERGVTFNLAVESAPYYGIEPIGKVTEIASATYAALAKAHQRYFQSDVSFLPLGDAQYGPGWGWPFP
jgi:hypothetical protein